MSFPDLANLTFADFEKRISPVFDQFLIDYKDKLEGKQIDQAQAITDMYDLVHGKFQIHWKQPAPEVAAEVSSQCVSMIVTVSVDVLMVFIGLLGVPDSVARATAVDLVNDLPESEMVALEKQIQAIADAQGITNQAQALIQFMTSFYKITGIRQILGALEHNMAWYEWVLMGVTITAQVTAWVATDFVSALAELVLETAAIAQTVADAITCVEDCQSAQVFT